MIRVRFDSSEIKTYPGRDGRPDRRVQVGMVSYSNGEVRRWEVGLNRDQTAFAVGEYTLADTDFYAGKYGPEVSGWPRLQSVKKAA